MERCREDFRKSRYGHVRGQISQKVDVSFDLLNLIIVF